MTSDAVKRAWLLASVFLVAVILWAFSLYSPVLFQRGNPLPYMAAAMQIDEENRYAKVGVSGSCYIYISLRDDSGALFQDMAYDRGFEFVEQVGSGYLFSDGSNQFTISSEIYLRYFTVWTVPMSASTEVRTES